MKTRKIFPQLVEELENNKILLLVWPRQVGKTTLLQQLQKEVKNKETYFLTLEDTTHRELLNIHPYKLFEITGIDSKIPQIIFIDEIQYLENPSNFLKLLYDMYKENIKLVVSWSSSFYIDQKFENSLMGRKELYEIFTLDFEEFLDFREEPKIKELLFIDKKLPVGYKSRIQELFLEYITYWGYPEVVLLSNKEKKIRKLGLLSQDYIKKDIYDANISEITVFMNILKVLAGQTGELVNANTLANAFGVSLPTVKKYLYIMQKSYCISLMKPFWTNITTELTKMPKVYFFDLGLRNSLLKNFENINERLDKGQFFENVVWREMVFQYGLDEMRYWRTQQENEVDFIIEEKKAYEVKFTKNLIRESKYKLFRKKYSHISLEFITFEDIIEKVIIQ